MKVSVFSFLMSVMFSTVFILAVHALRNRTFFLRSFGAHTLLIMYGLCISRMVFPMEMPITAPVGLRGGYYSSLYAVARDAAVTVGGARVELPDMLRAVWMTVAVALLFRLILAEWSLRRGLKSCDMVKSAAAQESLERVRTEEPGPSALVYACAGVGEPVSFGIFRGKIYIPDREYGRDDLYYIMKHEYTHICNRDSLVKLLTLVFCLVFWWNPAAYMLKRDVEQILEIKCDVGATQGLEKDRVMEYLTTIVRVLRSRKGKRVRGLPLSAVGMMNMTENEEIRERFKMLVKASRPVGCQYQYFFLAAVFAAFLFTYVLVVQPAYEPPEDEMYVNSVDGYILRCEDGTYTLVFDNGNYFDNINDGALETYMNEGFEVREE